MNRDAAGADMLAFPAIDAGRCLPRIYMRDPLTSCSQCQKPHGTGENFRLLFVSRTHSHTAEALNAVVESHDPVDQAHRNRTETFAFMVSVAFFIDGRKAPRDAPDDLTSIDDEVLDHGKIVKRLQDEVSGHRHRAGKTRFPIDHHRAFPAVTSFTVEPKGKAWVKVVVYIE